ncbi:Lipoxygenase [Corchorus olitorius]|uniref:Lipoxygenase n=1 Tax=Corchorus olitorius TaxID=93759 RepID=A0A1R3JWG2_9ROSI|nr:Lipoxygenase [Corchorus olitorius]
MGTKKHKIQATVVIIGRIPCNEAGNFVSATPYQISLQLSSQKQNVSFRLVSADNSNIGDPAYLEDKNGADSIYSVNFDWDEKFGTPGAILVRNSLENTEFYLKSVTLENVPGRSRIHFVCNSWVYKDEKNHSDRVFFTNKTLGGNAEFPYPRRDPSCESRIPLLKSLLIYVPRDEKFSFMKLSDFLGYALKLLPQNVFPFFEAFVGDPPKEFASFNEVLNIYGDQGPLRKASSMLDESLKEFFKYPRPQVIQTDTSAWRTDAEFGREMLAGVNPVVICRLQEFPPTSKLDPKVYGNQNSLIRKEHIERNMCGCTIEETLKDNKLFILDHHDSLMPYLRRINTTSTKLYASRTLLLLTTEGTLKPLAIELSYPHPEADIYGCVSKVYTPAEGGVEATIWELAKAYIAVNDSGYHQLISHWYAICRDELA